MAAYVIVDIEITDPVQYAEYARIVPELVARFAGRYLVRGGRAETLEGDWQPRRVVLLEFPSYERACAWWASDDYSGAKELRQSCSTARMVVVEGV